MSLQATDADMGKQGKCSRCGTVFTIQMPQAFAPPATPYQPPQSQAAPEWSDVTPGVIRVGEGISRGFTVLHSNLGVFILIALCFMGIQFGVGIAGQIPCLGAIISLANTFLLQPVLICGFYRACLKQHDGTTAEVGDLFAEFSQWVDILLLALAVVGISLLVMLPGLIVFGIGFIPLIVASMQNQPQPQVNVPILVAGGVLLFICIIAVNLALMFTYPTLVDRRKGVGDALRMSWRLMSSNPLGAFGAMMLGGLIGIGGVLACCVGLLYAVPAVQCMFAAIYRTAIPPHAWPQAVTMSAPPPTWQPPPPAGPAAPLPPPQAPGGTF
jgi:hypothetical protein